MTTRLDHPRRHGPKPPRIALPDATQLLDQDSEWCVLERDGKWHELRFHDYAAIYGVPGLYERIFYDLLRCNSPRVVVRALARELERLGRPPHPLRVLDLGAGNGMVAEELARAGAEHIIGLDILPEAKLAAERDRPAVYDDYLVVDLCSPPDHVRARLADARINCLTCVAALGFDDVPTRAFVEAVSYVVPGGLIAFNIKEDFLGPFDGSGYGGLLRELVGQQQIRPLRQRRYRHRNATSGDPLYYILVIAEKVSGRLLS